MGTNPKNLLDAQLIIDQRKRERENDIPKSKSDLRRLSGKETPTQKNE